MTLRTPCVSVRVDVADSNRGKCKVSKTAFKPGDLRFGYPVGKVAHVFELSCPN